jgi:hypothetical protein
MEKAITFVEGTQTWIGNLTEKRDRLLRDAERVSKAIAFLEAHPELVELYTEYVEIMP